MECEKKCRKNHNQIKVHKIHWKERIIWTALGKTIFELIKKRRPLGKQVAIFVDIMKIHEKWCIFRFYSKSESLPQTTTILSPTYKYANFGQKF